MSENTDKPAVENTSAGPEAGPNGSDGNHTAGAKSAEDIVATLKRDLASSRLPPDLLAQFLAELPPEEERERLYREMQEKGGYSIEDIFASLDDVEPQP
jgi:hypothetical protein